MKPDYTLCPLSLECSNADMILRCLVPRIHDPEDSIPFCFKPESKEDSCDENI